MDWFDPSLFRMLKESGFAAQGIVGFVLGVLLYRLVAVEKRLDVLLRNCPECRKLPPPLKRSILQALLPVALAILMWWAAA